MKATVRKLYLNALCDYCMLGLEGVALSERMRYILGKYYGILFNRRCIKWRGRIYHYDNFFGSALLQLAQEEIERLDNVINLRKIQTVLDIGANVGQWTFALKSYYPNIKAWSFEPCSYSFSRLVRNAGQFKDWSVYNYAVGEGSTRSLYYDPGISPSASFIKRKVEQRCHKNILQEEVVIARIEEPNYPSSYDLVKIDVEGSELEVISVMNVKYRYLCIETHDENDKQLAKLLPNSEEIYRHYPPFEGVVELVFENQRRCYE